MKMVAIEFSWRHFENELPGDTQGDPSSGGAPDAPRPLRKRNSVAIILIIY